MYYEMFFELNPSKNARLYITLWRIQYVWRVKEFVEFIKENGCGHNKKYSGPFHGSVIFVVRAHLKETGVNKIFYSDKTQNVTNQILDMKQYRCRLVSIKALEMCPPFPL